MATRKPAAKAPTRKARAEETALETVRRILLTHKALAYGGSNPVRCGCGHILAPAGEILHRDELHVDHVLRIFETEGIKCS
jgi:hypothetical protein